MSLEWIGFGVGINVAWLLYAFAERLPGLIPVSAGALVLYCWMLRSVRRVETTAFRRAIGPAMVVALALLISVVVGGLALFGASLGIFYTVQFAPAAWQSVRQTDLAGLAPSTWLMALLEAAIWAFYGFVATDIALIIGGLGALSMSLVVFTNIRSASTHTIARRPLAVLRR